MGSGSETAGGETLHALSAVHSPEDHSLRIKPERCSDAIPERASCDAVASSPLSGSEAIAGVQQISVGVVGGGHEIGSGADLGDLLVHIVADQSSTSTDQLISVAYGSGCKDQTRQLLPCLGKLPPALRLRAVAARALLLPGGGAAWPLPCQWPQRRKQPKNQ